MEFFNHFPQEIGILIVFKLLPTKKYEQRLDRFPGGGPKQNTQVVGSPRFDVPKVCRFWGSPMFHITILSPASSLRF